MLYEKKNRKRKMWSKKWYLKNDIIIRCSSAELMSALRWCHRGVGRQTEETVGFREWTAQFSMWKATGKDSYVACAIACQNYAVYSIFPSGMTSHSKIVQLKWQCLASFRNIPYLVLQYKQVQILGMDLLCLEVYAVASSTGQTMVSFIKMVSGLGF